MRMPLCTYVIGLYYLLYMYVYACVHKHIYIYTYRFDGTALAAWPFQLRNGEVRSILDDSLPALLTGKHWKAVSGMLLEAACQLRMTMLARGRTFAPGIAPVIGLHPGQHKVRHGAGSEVTRCRGAGSAELLQATLHESCECQCWNSVVTTPPR